MSRPFAIVLGEPLPLGNWPACNESSVPLMCQAISNLWADRGGADFVFFIARESAAGQLPAIALAQRTAHRRVAGYLLVEADAPASSDAWPDAPVVAFTSDPNARPLSLRGWPVRVFTTQENLVEQLNQEMHLLLG